MDQKANPIQPPPSVDDLLALGTDSRVGQVDFATRLVAVPDAARDERPEPAATVLPHRRVVEAVPDAPEAQDQTQPETQPVAEPATAPEVEASVEPEPQTASVVETDAGAEPEAVVEPEPVAPVARTRKPAKPRTAAKDAAKTTTRKPAARKPARQKPALEPAAPVVTLPTAVPPIMPIANLSGEPTTAAPASSPVETTVSHAALSESRFADHAPTLRMPVEHSEPVPVPRPQPRAQASVQLGDPAVDDTSYLGATVQAVADAAIERLRDAENATLHHLAALEAEAARRAELLTAQAELDAELIRITARREAHAIISAARTQAGLGSPSAQSSRDSRQLAEISDAVSRFAESIETTLAPLQPNLGDRS